MGTTITDKRYPKTSRTAIEVFEMLPKAHSPKSLTMPLCATCAKFGTPTIIKQIVYHYEYLYNGK